MPFWLIPFSLSYSSAFLFAYYNGSSEFAIQILAFLWDLTDELQSWIDSQGLALLLQEDIGRKLIGHFVKDQHNEYVLKDFVSFFSQ